MTTTPSEQRFDRASLLANAALIGRAFTASYTQAVDQWLSQLYEQVFAGSNDIALVVTGGHGRGELAPHSDLDVLLLHRGVLQPELAQQLWYPVWDSGFKLGHAVRTVKDTIALAGTDIATATALLSTRHLAGAADLAAELVEGAARGWRNNRQRWLSELATAVEQRHAQTIDVAYALEPDLKDGRGGLRDIHAINWSMFDGEMTHGEMTQGLAQMTDHYDVLLAARVELHRVTGRPGDRLHLQSQDEIAERLNDASADVLMARIATAARGIGWASDEHWHDLRRSLNTKRFFQRADKPRILSASEFGAGIISVDGRISLADDVTPSALSILQVGVAAASEDQRISRATLERLAAAPPLSHPWPEPARVLFVQLLAFGHRCVGVIETLDEANLWSVLIPEWEPNRCKPQRNAYHRFTVDRHLLETVAQAAELISNVERPDLLLVGALLHDIGKGYPGDHTDVGMVLAQTIAERIGFDNDDQRMIITMVEHHLLLPDIATRRDLDDPATIRWVAAQSGTFEQLHLLAALTEADSIATGSAAWGPWKAGLVRDLVARTERVLLGDDANDLSVSPERLAEQRQLMQLARVQTAPMLVIAGNQLTVACRDQPGVFSRIAGVLAICGLEVVEASAFGEEDMVLDRFHVTSGLGSEIPWDRVQQRLMQALCGRLAIEPRLAERARTYRRPTAHPHALQPRVRILNEASDDATVIEVTGPDSIGLLYRLTRALADMEVEIVRAKVVTMGHDVVDAFYVREASGAKIIDPGDVSEIHTALVHALTVD